MIFNQFDKKLAKPFAKHFLPNSAHRSQRAALLQSVQNVLKSFPSCNTLLTSLLKSVCINPQSASNINASLDGLQAKLEVVVFALICCENNGMNTTCPIELI